MSKIQMIKKNAKPALKYPAPRINNIKSELIKYNLKRRLLFCKNITGDSGNVW